MTPEPERPAGRVDVRVDDDVCWITLERSERLNALDPPMLSGLADALDGVADTGARAVVISGAGERAFCAGADVRVLAETPPEDVLRSNLTGHDVFDRIQRLPVPVVAAISGVALGGGLELALACDVRVAAEHSRLGLPEVSMGVIPGWGGTWRLAEAVGAARARELILTGRLVDAEEAARLGMVHDVVPGERLVPAVTELAVTFASRSAPALAAAKRALAAVSDHARSQAQVESGAVASLVTGAEFRSRVAGFLGTRA
ncbi:enoyl-CoA hydratase [Haloactinopolyspora alba]|uniref:enoyl-CoA hydratase n=1 Tax=Haloactinopolyspora alba TaxID=648780 RepID=A0A2P8E9I5_9ACTN|nr:enoyl-CoA hydratase/isomerase family protein [Haloactinopolyspora alba]PSL06118.1 enoyl-CoA hydratase [Haloactinopolyspora alba]